MAKKPMKQPDAHRRVYNATMSDWTLDEKPICWRCTYWLDDELYSLEAPGNTKRPIDFDTFAGVLVPKDKLYTPLLPHYTICDPAKVESSDFYLKKPNVDDYSRSDNTDYAALARFEIAICEDLAKLPSHPNLLRYHGVVPDTAGERVVALCYDKHGSNLRDAMDPDRSSAEAIALLDREQIMLDVKHAIEHLHNLGYIQNDVNPNNILLPLNGGSSPAILADFDSCTKVGVLEGTTKRGTRGFMLLSDDGEPAAVAQDNDWYGWQKTAEFLGLQGDRYKGKGTIA